MKKRTAAGRLGEEHSGEAAALTNVLVGRRGWSRLGMSVEHALVQAVHDAPVSGPIQKEMLAAPCEMLVKRSPFHLERESIRLLLFPTCGACRNTVAP